MNERETALRERLLTTFRVEAAEHIATLFHHLLELEKRPAGESAANGIELAFREVHSLKSAARAVNLADIETVCQALENVLAGLKRGTLALSVELLEVLLRGARTLEALPATAVTAGTGGPPLRLAPILAALEQASEGHAPAAPADAPRMPSLPVTETERPAIDGVRVSAATLDAVRRQAEELLAETTAARQQVSELQHLGNTVGDWQKRWTHARGDLRKLLAVSSVETVVEGSASRTRALERFNEFLEWNKQFIDTVGRQLAMLTRTAQQSQRSLDQKVDGLLDDSSKLLMLPCSWLLDGLRRVVRDLARDQGKEVELIIEGEAIEIDRRILTELKEPFVHVLRNSMDHGIEPPVERAQAGKPRAGTITIRIAQVRGKRVEISVRDDGRGVDVARVKGAAVKRGLLRGADADQLEAQAALNLVFESDISTSPLITELSGRGLGLAIVREKVERLGGTVSLASAPGTGTTLRCSLPLSLATFRGVVIRVAERTFVVPSANVDRVTRVAEDQIRSVENRETIAWGGQAIPLVRLAETLGIPRRAEFAPAGGKVPALILVSASTRMAFLVDEVCQEQEVLVKSLGPQLQSVPNVDSATVLGSGMPAPILKVAELIQAAIHGSGSASGPPRAAAAATRKSSILVVEDSITSRTLLKNILEMANYTVETALDGVDALTKLHSGGFDLVVSDVDMPRLNGLGLTARIRADQKLANMPVVLVTSLESREDRERGIEVGANAYIVKRSFDQSNLLDVIQRLI